MCHQDLGSSGFSDSPSGDTFRDYRVSKSRGCCSLSGYRQKVPYSLTLAVEGRVRDDSASQRSVARGKR